VKTGGSAQKLLASPRPWHVLLSPVLPLLVFFRGSGSGATPHSIVWPLAAMLGLALLAWMVVAGVSRDARRSALFVTILTLATFGYFALSDLANYLGHRSIVAVLYPAVLVGAALVWQASTRIVTWMTTAANIGLVVATLLQAGLAVGEEQQVLRNTSVELPAALRGTDARVEQQRPDIYVLILEGYGRADVLRDNYGFENDLVPRLRSMGFFVADRAAANYPQLGQSLAAALNLEYLPDLLEPPGVVNVTFKRRLGRLIRNNRFFPLLHSAGYYIRSYESEYAFLRPRPADDRPGPLIRFTNFEYRLYEGSLLPRVIGGIGQPRGVIPAAVHRHHVQWTLDRLATEVPRADDRPTFVFAHVLMPHPPFTFEPDGRARPTRVAIGFNDGDFWRELAGGTGERYESGYVDAVKYLNSRVPDVVQQVLARSTRPTIFYILSNHGPAARLRWERPDASSVRERLGILLAVRFPDGDHEPLHDRSTPVTAFRALLNRALGTALPTLEDRSYFSTWEREWMFTDVTVQIE
jgi:hypothetical protein